jgi:branched-chain amino acid transport system ATP-binding protein
MTKVAMVEVQDVLEPEVALELKGVQSGYERTTILRDVSLQVKAGSVTALIGPNGAGKSTLLKTAVGLLNATEGEIFVNGEAVTGRPPYSLVRSGVCLIPEGRAVYKSLTVRENLIMQARRGEEGEVIERASSAFPLLGRRLNQRAGTLSGGEQQMLAMSAAYSRRPSLILVDEPSMGLAPLVVDLIFEFLQQVANDGAALLLVDQYVTRVLTMATQAYVLRRGQIVFGGAPQELLAGEIFEQYMGTG